MIKGDYILLASYTGFDFYHYNSSTNTYQLNFTATYGISKSYYSASFSSDGSMITVMMNMWNDPDFTLLMYSLDQSNGSYSVTTHNMGVTSGSSRVVNDIGLERSNNGTYYLISIVSINYLY